MIEKLTPKDFINWVLIETNKSKYQDLSFNTWHKNQWDIQKLQEFGEECGFSNVEVSKYGDSIMQLNDRIEKPGHASIGLYFNLIK